MANKEQLIKAIYRFIDNDMLPKAEGNYKIILGIAKSAINHSIIKLGALFLSSLFINL